MLRPIVFTCSIYLLLSICSATQNDAQPDISSTISSAIEAMTSEDYELSLKLIRKAIQIAPENPELYRLEAQILELLDDPDEAIKAWEKCIFHTQNDSLIYEAKHHINSLKE